VSVAAPALAAPIFDTVARFLCETPPLYLVTVAIVAGDALGNTRYGAPYWLPIMLGVMGAAMRGWSVRVGRDGLRIGARPSASP